MGRKVFISFLGTSSYLNCNYYLSDNEKIENVEFVQEALIKIFFKNVNENNHIYIFTTEKAKNNNYENKLKIILEKLKKENEYKNISFSNIMIPEGKSEEQIMKIFENVYNSFEENDAIIYDITHSFRSLPMLGITVLFYAKFLKNIKIDGIYYGAFEVLGAPKDAAKIPIEKRDAPIFNLTSFAYIIDWSFGVSFFIKYGNSDYIAEIIKEFKRILNTNSNLDKMLKYNLNNIFNNINKMITGFSQNILACRGNKINNEFNYDNFKYELTEIKKFESVFLKPMIPLVDKLEQKISKFKNNDIKNGFRAVEWCVDHGLIQQGITLLQENIITYFVNIISSESFDKKNLRMGLSSYFNHFDKYKYNYEQILNNFSELNIKNCKIKNFLESKISNFLKDENLKIIKLYNRLRDLRNDINHAGFVESPANFIAFKNSLQKNINELKEILEF